MLLANLQMLQTKTIILLCTKSPCTFYKWEIRFFAVNPNLYAIHLSTNPPRLTGEVSVSRRHPNDVHLSGFSDQIFHSMASTCSGGQLERIECVDKRFNLHCSTSHFSSGGDEGLEEKLNVSWPRVRVFISSTFDDMHGERDLIHRYIFPELRRRCRGIRMDVVPVDLRSGH